MKTGLVLGKFYPPHKGHLYLIEEARKRVDFLLVVVGSLQTEDIPGKKRAEWLRLLVPKNTQVLHIPDDNPVGLTDKEEDYWVIWKENLQRNLPFIPNELIGSEGYIVKLAKMLGMSFYSVDPDRVEVPISATKIRENPRKYWGFIPEVVQKYYDTYGIDKIGD